MQVCGRADDEFCIDNDEFRIENEQVGKALMKLRRSQLTNTDNRVRLISEALAGIRVVKYNVMEDWLAATINDVREQELNLLRKQVICNIEMMEITLEMMDFVPTMMEFY